MLDFFLFPPTISSHSFFEGQQHVTAPLNLNSDNLFFFTDTAILVPSINFHYFSLSKKYLILQLDVSLSIKSSANNKISVLCLLKSFLNLKKTLLFLPFLMKNKLFIRNLK